MGVHSFRKASGADPTGKPVKPAPFAYGLEIVGLSSFHASGCFFLCAMIISKIVNQAILYAK